MKAITVGLSVVAMFLAFTTVPVPVLAADRSDECVAMTQKAESLITEKGKDYALKVFSVSKGPFIDQELYVFAVSMDNRMLAHPYRRDLIGQDVNEVRDAENKLLFQEFRSVAEKRGDGWVNYWWSKSGEAGIFPKTTYIKRIADHNMYVGVGYYKPAQTGANPTVSGGSSAKMPQ